MWVFFSDNINRERCACTTMLDGQDRGKRHYCNSCGRTWEQVSCDWWAKKRPDQLIPGPHWKFELVEVIAFSSAVRKYLATNTESGLGVLLDSVSNVQDVIGAGDKMIHWAAMQTLREAIRPWWGKHFSDEEMRAKLMVPARNGGTRTADLFSDVIAQLPESVRSEKLTLSLDDMIATLDRAVHARRQVAQLAAEYGTRAHELIHAFLVRGGTWDYPGPDGTVLTTPWEQEEAPVAQAISNFLRFWAREDFEMVASEVTVGDVRMGVAGTLDAIVRDPAGNLVMLDWKTSKSMREKYLIQVAAYCRMYEKMDLGYISRAFIIRIDKESAALQIVPAYTDPEQYKQVSLDYAAALRLHRFQKRASKHFKEFGTEILEEEAV